MLVFFCLFVCLFILAFFELVDGESESGFLFLFMECAPCQTKTDAILVVQVNKMLATVN